MISQKQYLEKKDKTKKVVDYFLAHPTATINEISIQTGIKTSSVQRYLSTDNEAIICELYNIETFKKILVQMKDNYLNAKRKGGNTFAQNNIAVKDDNGHFIGSQKR